MLVIEEHGLKFRMYAFSELITNIQRKAKIFRTIRNKIPTNGGFIFTKEVFIQEIQCVYRSRPCAFVFVDLREVLSYLCDQRNDTVVELRNAHVCMNQRSRR